MPSNSPLLPIAEYSFNYHTTGEVQFDTFAGSIWHGSFGRALRERACITMAPRCDHCLLLHNCEYSYLFSGPRPPEATLMRRYETIPVPHCFRIDNPKNKATSAEQVLSVGMTLVGKANQRLPVVINAMAAAGLNGLGKKRKQARLVEVVQTGPNYSPRIIMNEHKPCDTVQSIKPELPQVPNTVRIKFVTPFINKKAAPASDRIDVPRFLAAIVRRISLLQYFYTGKELKADFKQQKDRILGKDEEEAPSI